MKKTTTKKAVNPTSAAKPELKKAAVDAPAVKAAKAKNTTSKTVKVLSIDKACEGALDKLRELNLDTNLQSEIVWCLGSYQNDKNPGGLYVMAKRALSVFSVELASKTKGVTAKLVSDLEKAIGTN